MNDRLIIRPEHPEDYAAVEQLTRRPPPALTRPCRPCRKSTAPAKRSFSSSAMPCCRVRRNPRQAPAFSIAKQIQTRKQQIQAKRAAFPLQIGNTARFYTICILFCRIAEAPSRGKPASQPL